MVRQAITDIVGGARLDSARAESVMDAIMDGAATPAQIAGLLVALRMRGETPDELTGFARSMRSHVLPIQVTRRPLIDTCGTGGGGQATINVSTGAALVAAGAGVAVAKHGNRAMTSACGSADVLEALGIAIEAAPEAIAAGIESIGIGFLFAPRFHPAMKHAIGPRREIGVRSAFNLLGPMTNPAGADGQVIGVPEPGLCELVAQVLARLGTRRAWVVHGLDGVDELSVAGPSRVCELRDGAVRQFEVRPGAAGLAEHGAAAVAGGDAASNAAQLERVLHGETGAVRDFVVLNAAAALVVGGLADDLAGGAALAQASLDSGAARAKLEAWRAWSAAQG